MPAALPPKLPVRKRSTTTLRKLAQAHTKAAVQALVEVATKGTSEASRISAAKALIDCGHGKSGAGIAPAPILYHRIELVDGIDNKFSAEDPASDHQD